MSVIADFAAEVGPSDPVTCVGGRTQWSVGGRPADGVREVSAPSGVVAHEPGEMIVRVRAGTSLADLAEALAVGGQFVTLESETPDQATVGGVLACGQGGVRRLGYGPIRDSVLEVTAIAASGQPIRAGAPLVKNVTGFDLCRLLVGSVGTLGVLAEVVLRCHPQVEAEQWWTSAEGTDPFRLIEDLYRPLAVLWDGRAVWVGLAGRQADVAAQAALLPGFSPVDGPPPVPTGARRSVPPAQLRTLAGGDGFLAEVGVGLVHFAAGDPAVPVAPAASGVVELHRRIKDRFDPTGRLNPGRSPLRAAS
ncbi:MAG TPA: FAD-binding protein [Acidimicrobiales bacterium]|jgi:glycolate oxidase FAD binding subunit|nr:FAD-binding protein [Acidimicrobiales bacterium]